MYEKLEAVEELIDIDLQGYMEDLSDPNAATQFFDLNGKELN